MLRWEYLESDDGLPRDREYAVDLYRAIVPGGWLIMTVTRTQAYDTSGAIAGHDNYSDRLVFVSDPGHDWDGSSPDPDRA